MQLPLRTAHWRRRRRGGWFGARRTGARRAGARGAAQLQVQAPPRLEVVGVVSRAAYTEALTAKIARDGTGDLSAPHDAAVSSMPMAVGAGSGRALRGLASEIWIRHGGRGSRLRYLALARQSGGPLNLCMSTMHRRTLVRRFHSVFRACSGDGRRGTTTTAEPSCAHGPQLAHHAMRRCGGSTRVNYSALAGKRG